MKRRIFICLAAIIFMMNFLVLYCQADGEEDSVYASKNQDTLSVTADRYVILEASTNTFLAGQGSYEEFSASHFTKLMTLTLVSEKIDEGELSLDDTVAVSEYANSQQGTQIWLDKGEKITVSELIKAVTIGNANDACVALSETVDKKISDFVERMNKRAAELQMINTVYVDCTGVSNDNITTAHDTALLASELLKHEYLTEYLTAWRDFVGEKQSEVVNQNTLVKSYDGITGLKACVSSTGVNMTSVSAKRGEMSVVCVAVGSESSEQRAVDGENMLDYALSQFQIYEPEIDKTLLDDIKIVHGEDESVKVSLYKPLRLVIKRGTSSELDVTASREQSITAPKKKGDKVGSVTVTNGEKTAFSTSIVLCDDAERITVKKAFLKLIYSLIGEI
ncbi:MAG: serine hydrolase [Ruminococcus sp.]|nr:serine hydrolase [Ruminococcus sp.]